MVKTGKVFALILALLVVLSTLTSIINIHLLAQSVIENSEETTASSTKESTSKAVNVTAVMIVKAEALKDILSRVLYLNISNELKKQIELLLSINLTALDIDKLKEWIHNATKVLASVANELKECREFEVGIALQRYLNGLRVALVNRVEALARRYNVSVEELKKKIEEILVNASKAPDINKMFKKLIEMLRNTEVEKTREFAEKAKEYSYRYAERVRGGEAKGLDVAIKHIEEVMKILNRTLEKLRDVNASVQAIEAIEKSIERLWLVKEILENVTKEIIESAKPEPKKIKEVFNITLSTLIYKVNNSINELLEELEDLRIRSVNFSDIVIKIDELKDLLLNLRDELKNIENISEIKEIIDKVSDVKLKVLQLRKQIDILTKEYINKLQEKIRDIAENLVKKAEEKLSKVKDLYNNIKKEVEETVCIMVFPPPPKCIIIENIKKMLPLVEKQIAEAEQDLNNAKKSLDEENYAIAIASAQKALAKLIASENQLRLFEEMLKTTEKSQSQPPRSR